MRNLFEALSLVPGLAHLERRDLRIEKLGGLTNNNYKVSGAGICAVVRLPGAGTEDYVNRNFEIKNLRAAAAAGVSPEILYSDVRRGIVVTRFIEGAEPLDAKRAGTTPLLARVGNTLRQLHTRSDVFVNNFNPFHQLERYVSILAELNHKPKARFVEVISQLRPVRKAIEARPNASVPCHCDLLPENILDDGNKLLIIDFEFSGNYHPLWDLGDFSGEADLNKSQDDTLLMSYFDSAISTDAHALFVIFKAVSLLLAAGWAQVQIANGNIYAAFDTYADIRLNRCCDIIVSEDIDRLCTHLMVNSKSVQETQPV